MNNAIIPVKRFLDHNGLFLERLINLGESGVYRNIPDGYAHLVSLAKNIRRARQKADLNQHELGERLGVGQGAVSKWEKGATEPAASMLPEIALVTQSTVEELCRGVSEDYDRALGPVAPSPRRETAIHPDLMKALQDQQMQRAFRILSHDRMDYLRKWLLHEHRTLLEVELTDETSPALPEAASTTRGKSRRAAGRGRAKRG